MIGVDFTPEMLAIGRAKLQRLDLAHRVELAAGRWRATSTFPDDMFDACCSAFVVRNLDDLPAGFKEMLRVVKPGGRSRAWR